MVDFATKQDLVELESRLRSEIKTTVYTVGLIQFLAILGTIVGIMSFMLSHLK